MQCALKLCKPAAAKEQPVSPQEGSSQAAVVDRMEEVRLALLEAASQRSLYRPLVLRTTSRAVAVLLAVAQGQRLLVKAAGGCPDLPSSNCISWVVCPEVEPHMQFWEGADGGGRRLRPAGPGVRWAWMGAMLLSCCVADCCRWTPQAVQQCHGLVAPCNPRPVMVRAGMGKQRLQLLWAAALIW